VVVLSGGLNLGQGITGNHGIADWVSELACLFGDGTNYCRGRGSKDRECHGVNLKSVRYKSQVSVEVSFSFVLRPRSCFELDSRQGGLHNRQSMVAEKKILPHLVTYPSELSEMLQCVSNVLNTTLNCVSR
jgi:hypothetical protein